MVGLRTFATMHVNGYESRVATTYIAAVRISAQLAAIMITVATFVDI